MVAPFPLHVLPDNGKMYTPTKTFEELSIQSIVEEELKGESWEHFNDSVENKTKTIQVLSAKPILKMHLRRYLSDTASNKKRVPRDCLFSCLQYDLLISKIDAKIYRIEIFDKKKLKKRNTS